MTMTLPRTFREAEAILARSLPNYESRPQQQRLADAIEGALASKTHLLAEAGCGTGKSLGYLIPAILSGKRVIVSTATKALQNQVFDLDLPFLSEHMGVEFTFALLKGRSNYLCVNKVMAAEPDKVPHMAEILRRTEDEDFNGEREDLGFEVEHAEWMQVAAESEDCQSLDCKTMGTCYAERARAFASRADIVVVNHALFCTDLMVQIMTRGYGGMLGAYDVVVFDEAHEVEEYASSTFGARFTEGQMAGLTTQIRNFVSRNEATGDGMVDEVLDKVALVNTAMTRLWQALPEPKDGNVIRLRDNIIVELGDEFSEAARGLYEMADAIRAYRLATTDEKTKKRHTLLTRRASSLADKFAEIIVADSADLVRWIEVEKRVGKADRTIINTAPVSVAPILRDGLFNFHPEDGEKRKPATAILVSATMTTPGDSPFAYITSRLGIDDFAGLDVGTPFDFHEQALLYVPRSMPAPDRDGRAAWENLSVYEIGELVRASDGRALLLFSSTRQMRKAYDTLAPDLPYTCLMQGQKPFGRLVEEFKADHQSVLFGTRSFFTGVDFQGDVLSLVVMDKLPFPVPTEPLTEARCEAIKRAGGSDFTEYVVPVMSMILKQGFGRLIRHRNDRGVVAILDSRLMTKGYGKKIMGSLPPAAQATTQAEVKTFFAAA